MTRLLDRRGFLQRSRRPPWHPWPCGPTHRGSQPTVAAGVDGVWWCSADPQPVLGARSARPARRPEPRRHRHHGRSHLEHQLAAGRRAARHVHAYMLDTEALEFPTHRHARVVAMRRVIRQLRPGICGQIMGVAHKAWQEDPRAGGVCGWTQPGELRWMFPAMRQVEGPRPLLTDGRDAAAASMQ
jgi:hypothetical protein